MAASNSKWTGLQLNIYSEVCCDYCNEVVHNHFDCPVCGEKSTASDNYYDLNEDKGDCTVECKCGAKFNTKHERPYDDDAIWEQVA
jgi:hypothetical protein